MAKAVANVKKMANAVDTWETNAIAASADWATNVAKPDAKSAYNANVAASAGKSPAEVASGSGKTWSSFADQATGLMYEAGIKKPDAKNKLKDNYASGVVRPGRTWTPPK